MSRFQKLAVTAAILSYLLIVLGGIVRLDTSGTGCGQDWPLCADQLIPSKLTAVTIFDLAHRATAIVVVGVILALVVSGWKLRRENRLFFLLPTIAGATVLTQVGLGLLDLAWSLPDGVVAVHLSLALLGLAVLIGLALTAYGSSIAEKLGRPLGRDWTSLGRLAFAAGLIILLLMVSGAYTTTAGAASGCTEWPLCNGSLLPDGWTATDIQLTHRIVALLATFAVLAVALQARRVRFDSPALVALATAAGALMAAQIFVGAAGIWLELSWVLGPAHLAVATVIWALLVLIWVLDRFVPVSAVERESVHRRVRQIINDYVTLTKPGVLQLLLITTLGAMLIAQAGLPPLSLMFWTLLGGALSAGGAGALNHYMDRDIDAIMTRTKKRPIPGGRVPAVHVPIFGITLTVLAVYVLTVFVNPLAALLALSGNLFYVLVYTRLLKRSTPQNIVIGGAAGAVPPLVGWAAVTNQVGLPALLLFAVIFYWTPPHFWALALFKSTDYAAAKVPMFPEVYGDAETRRHIFLYTVMLVITSLFFYALQVMGLFYFISALILGGIFLYKSYQLTRHPSSQQRLSRALFFYSMQYLGLLFVVMVIDRIVWY